MGEKSSEEPQDGRCASSALEVGRLARAPVARLPATVADAEHLAALVHADQLDKGEQPYSRHLGRVAASAGQRATHAQASGLAIQPEEVMQAAWLHDIIEDTPTRRPICGPTAFPRVWSPWSSS